MWATLLDAGATLTHAVPPGRHVWVRVARGDVTLNSVPLAAGDGAAVSDERTLGITADRDAEVLLFDLA